MKKHHIKLRNAYIRIDPPIDWITYIYIWIMSKIFDSFTEKDRCLNILVWYALWHIFISRSRQFLPMMHTLFFSYPLWRYKKTSFSISSLYKHIHGYVQVIFSIMCDERNRDRRCGQQEGWPSHQSGERRDNRGTREERRRGVKAQYSMIHGCRCL